MRKQLAIMGIGVLLIALCLSGCDQLLSTKPDHITVNTMATVSVNLVDANNNILNISADGVSVTIIMTRNGDNQLAFERIVQNRQCQATGVIVLSKGQYIECTATVQSGYNDYYPVAPGYAKLTWDTVNASTNIGGMYSWYPDITIQMKKGSII
jgi:hypothetical protein